MCRLLTSLNTFFSISSHENNACINFSTFLFCSRKSVKLSTGLGDQATIAGNTNN